ncbi:MAG: tRNA (adenosine(37)-N6)-threonylcarbamoyltransferase complex dimerization subunit type 1 TsaB [Gemmobacter sp.]
MRPDLPSLAFDTSGAHVAIRLTSPAVDRYVPMEKGQAESLMPLCEEVLAEGGVQWRDLRTIGVGVGPGNFTGIRIAVSAARGLALGLGIPAIGVTAFELAHQGRGYSGRVMVALPAPRGQAYVQTFVNGLPIAKPAVLTPGEVRDNLRQPNLIVIGHRAAEIAAPFNAAHDPADLFTGREEVIASNIDQVALNKRAAAGGTWTQRPAPLYVRAADALPPADPPPVILP